MFASLMLMSAAFAVPMTNYDPATDDLFEYDAPVTTADPATPIAWNESVVPRGYDFSGVNVRDRRFNNRSPHVSSSSDINDYNSGYVAIVLVSPKHALVSAHYIDAVPSQMSAVTFMAPDGTKHELNGVSRTTVGPDLKLITFDEALPADADIAVYDTFIDIATLPTPAPIYGIDSQGRLLERRAVPWFHQFNEQWTFTHEAFSYGQDHIGIIFSGDSGTPLFINDYQNNTYFLGTAWDADMKIDADVVANINRVIRDRTMQVSMIDYPYSPADFDLDGQVTSADLSLLLTAFGTDDDTTDMNGDGVVDGADLGLFYGSW